MVIGLSGCLLENGRLFFFCSESLITYLSIEIMDTVNSIRAEIYIPEPTLNLKFEVFKILRSSFFDVTIALPGRIIINPSIHIQSWVYDNNMAELNVSSNATVLQKRLVG